MMDHASAGLATACDARRSGNFGNCGHDVQTQARRSQRPHHARAARSSLWRIAKQWWSCIFQKRLELTCRIPPASTSKS